MGNINVTQLFSIILLYAIVFSTPASGNEYFTWKSNTGNNATVAVLLESDISVDGKPLERGDEIGAFTPAGLCVGGMVWCGEKNHAIAVWGDDFMTDEVDGIKEGEKIHFRVWRKSTNEERPISNTIFHNGITTYQINGIYVLIALNTVTAPERPTAISPVSDEEIAGPAAEFLWSTVSSASRYHFQLARDENFIDFVVDANELADTAYTVDELEVRSVYYWRVRASNSGGSSEWTESRVLYTKDELIYPPAVPILLAPTNNAAGISIAPVLLWSPIGSAERYHLQIAENAGFSSNLMEFTDLAGNQFQANLTHSTVYYWRVRAQNDGGMSDWSGVRNFTTVASGDIIVIQLERGWNMISSYVQPADPAIESIFSTIDDDMLFVKNRTGKVYWPSEGINEIGIWETTEGYNVYVSRNHILSIQGEPVVSENMPIQLSRGWNQPAFLYPLPVNIEAVFEGIVQSVELVKTHDGQIYWPVHEINDIGHLEPGRSYQVYMKGSASLIYPSQNADTKPMFAYSSISVKSVNTTPVVYQTAMSRTGESAILMVFTPYARDGDEIGVWDMSKNLVGAGVVSNRKAAITVWGNNPRTENVKDGAYENERLILTWFSGTNMQEKQISVHSIRNIAGNSGSDGDLRYTSNGISLVETYVSVITDEIPNNYTLNQNYPNPFNPLTIISYAIPNDEHVRITVYSTSGQIISTLVDERQSAGLYEIAFDAINLSSGMYIYHIQAGYYSSTRKMMLIR
jgi:hypothetical protein